MLEQENVDNKDMKCAMEMNTRLKVGFMSETFWEVQASRFEKAKLSFVFFKWKLEHGFREKQHIQLVSVTVDLNVVLRTRLAYFRL